MKNLITTITTTLVTAFFVQGVQAQLRVIDDRSFPIPPTVLMGSTGNLLAAYRFVNPSTTDNDAVIAIAILDSTVSSKGAFANLQLWSGTTLVATAATITDGSTVGYGGGWLYQFYLPAAMAIPVNGSVTLALRGDVASFTVQGAQDNSIHRFQIKNPVMVKNSSVSGSFAVAYGTPIRVLRSNLTMNVASDGQFGGILTLGASSAGAVVLNKLSITFSDEKGTPTFSSPETVLLSINGSDVIASGGAFTFVDGNTITWYFNQGFVIGSGNSWDFHVQVPFPINAVIVHPGDISFTDGLDATAVSGLNPDTGAFPLSVNAKG